SPRHRVGVDVTEAVGDNRHARASRGPEATPAELRKSRDAVDLGIVHLGLVRREPDGVHAAGSRLAPCRERTIGDTCAAPEDPAIRSWHHESDEATETVQRQAGELGGITGAERERRHPMSVWGGVFRLGNGAQSSPRVTSVSCSLPSRTKVIVTVLPAAFARICAVRSIASLTRTPSTFVTTSPFFRPPFSAPPPDTGSSAI